MSKIPFDDLHSLSRPTRRSIVSALAGVAAFADEVLAMQQPGAGGIPTRPLVKTGVRVSILGYGGWHAVANKTDEESIRLMHEAVDLGITFFDNAWEYHDGRAEEVMGRALQQNGLREKVFLMTKVCARDYEGARRQIDESLRRLRTDRIDLLQFHAIQYEGDAKRILEGGLKAALEAKEAGKVRFIGFTGHRDPKAHLEMLDLRHPWDTVQMPLNVLDASYRSFEQTVLPVCRKRGIGVLAMKALGGGMEAPVIQAGVSAELGRRYAMSLPVATVICGILNREQLHFHASLARNFKPLSRREAAAIVRRARPEAADGHLEAYKDPKQGYGCSWHSRVLQANA